MVNVKDVLIAVLVAYVVMDFACAFILKRKRPLLFKHMMNVAKKEKSTLFLCLGLSVTAGFGAYYLSSQQQ